MVGQGSAAVAAPKESPAWPMERRGSGVAEYNFPSLVYSCPTSHESAPLLITHCLCPIVSLQMLTMLEQ